MTADAASPPRSAADRAGVAGLGAIGLSFACTFVVAVAGPSVMEPVLPGRSGQPPWSLSLHLSAYLAVGLAALGVAAGAAGLVLLLRAIRGGWTVQPRAVLLAGVFAAVVLTLVPPFGSSDPLSYATYGRMVATGHNPYLTTPAQLAARGDPVARAVLTTLDWPDQPSVYGPLASGIQAVASLIGGTSVRLTVFVQGLANLLAFVVTALLLYRMSGSRERRLRAMLLWTANPLLLQVLVAGGHVDAQQIVFCVAAVAVLYRRASAGRAAIAGALAGLGFAIKVSAALVVAGLAVAMVLAPEGDWRGRPRGGLRAGDLRRLAGPLGALGAGFALVAGAAVAIGGSAMLTVTSRASDMVSIGSPWRAIRTALQHTAGYGAAGNIVKYGAVVLAVVLAVLMVRRAAELRCGPASLQVVLALAVAWLFAWPYVLPWYDGLGWVFLALVPASGLDWLMLARTAALGFAYLPARTAGAPLPPGLHWVRPVFRNGVSPVIITGTVVALIVITAGNRYSAWGDFGSVRSARSAGGSDRRPDGHDRAPARHPGGEGMHGADQR
jgi:hypothetical protein